MKECDKCGKTLWLEREIKHHKCEPYECYMLDSGEDLTTYNNMSKEDQDYCRGNTSTQYNHISAEYAAEEYVKDWDDEYTLLEEALTVLVWDENDVLKAFFVSAGQTVTYYTKELS